MFSFVVPVSGVLQVVWKPAAGWSFALGMQDLLPPSFEGGTPSDFSSRGYVPWQRVGYSVDYSPSAGFLPHGRPDLLSPSHEGDTPLDYPSRGYVSRRPFSGGIWHPFNGVCIYMHLGTICISGLSPRISLF